MKNKNRLPFKSKNPPLYGIEKRSLYSKTVEWRIENLQKFVSAAPDDKIFINLMYN